MNKKSENNPDKRGDAQSRNFNLSRKKQVENKVTKVKENSFNTNDLSIFFDCPDIVFKGWNFYDDNVYESVLFPVI
jgi:hypothetical protein